MSICSSSSSSRVVAVSSSFVFPPSPPPPSSSVGRMFSRSQGLCLKGRKSRLSAPDCKLQQTHFHLLIRSFSPSFLAFFFSPSSPATFHLSLLVFSTFLFPFLRFLNFNIFTSFFFPSSTNRLSFTFPLIFCTFMYSFLHFPHLYNYFCSLCCQFSSFRYINDVIFTFSVLISIHLSSLFSLFFTIYLNILIFSSTSTLH